MKMDKNNLYRLNNELSVEIDGGHIAIWDTRDHSPIQVTTITSDEFMALQKLYLDGCCPRCWEEIPQDDIVCDSCFQQAQSKR